MIQSHFARHLQAGSEIPANLIASDHAARRYAVYRNNVQHSLITALATRFPATKRLIGDACFHFCAKLFVESHKPQTPVLMFYGDDFADFLAGLVFLDAWPFLPDVARIEIARTYAFHAKDRSPFDASHLDAHQIDRLLSQHFEPHPAARVLQSSYPAATIWASSDDADALTRIQWQAETIAVTRGVDTVHVSLVPLGVGPCLTAIRTGATLAAALAIASEMMTSCDPPAVLAALLRCDLLSVPTKDHDHEIVQHDYAQECGINS